MKPIRLIHFSRLLLICCSIASLSAMAQQGAAPPPRIDVAAVTGADAKTATAVERVMRDHHDKMEALRQETDAQLAKLLNPAQLEKLHQAMRKNRPPEGGQQRSY